MSKTAIVLLNFNSFQDTFECVESIFDSGASNFQLVVVDNASQDDSLERLKSSFSDRTEVTFITSESNLGFSGGCNLGIQYALEKGFDYVLLLNNDTLVTTGFLEALINVAREKPGLGIVGGKTLFADGSKDIWDAGGYISKKSFRGIRRRKGDVGIDEIGEVGFVTCCLALVKAEVFEKIGLLPEAYFFGSEEWDFSLRARRAGYTLWYTPSSVIYHKVGRSHDHTTMRMVYNTFRNRLLFVKRNFNGITFLGFLHIFIGVKFFQTLFRMGQMANFSFPKGFRLLFTVYGDSLTKSKVTYQDFMKFGND